MDGWKIYYLGNIDNILWFASSFSGGQKDEESR